MSWFHRTTGRATCDTLFRGCRVRKQWSRIREAVPAAVMWLLFVCPIWCPAATFFSSVQARGQEHGSFQHLEHDLFRQNDFQRLLGRAGDAIRDGQLSAAAEILQTILSAEQDAFQLDADVKTVTSIRANAMSLLSESPEGMRTAWQHLVGRAADSELASAVHSGNRIAIRRVARKFPFTQAGINAIVLSLVEFRERGELDAARQYAAHWIGLYERHERWQAPVRKVQQTIGRLNSPDGSADLLRAGNQTRPSLMMRKVPETLSAPWPVPVWTWNAAGGKPGGLNVDLLSSDSQTGRVQSVAQEASFSNWVPLIRESSIIVRSTRQLLGFEKLSGKLIWMMDTDTGPGFASPKTADLPNDGLSGTEEESHRAAADWTTPRSSFGLLSGDDQYVFFVDHFRSPSQLRQSAEYPDRRRRFRAGRGDILAPGYQEFPDLPPPATPRAGERLTALRFSVGSAVPVVAWTIGTVPERPYLIRTHQSDQSDQSDQSVDAQPELSAPAGELPAGEFADHQFLTVPTGNDSHLFVLTGTNDRVWANCIAKSTGRLLWRQPVIFDQDLMIHRLVNVPETEKSDACLLHEDLVICVMSSGNVVGLSQADGQLRWATNIREENQGAGTVPYGVLDDGRTGTIAFLPLIGQSKLICSCFQSNSIFALDLLTGRILWKAPRNSSGEAGISSQPDHFAAGIFRDRIILLGSRHCRSIHPDSGEQQWITEVIQPTGRAWCSSDRCLVPESDGRIAVIETETGMVSRVAPSLLPDGSAGQYGSIAGDEEIVAVSLPDSVSVFLGSDALLKNPAHVEMLASKPMLKYLVMAQAQLLAGNTPASLDVLKEAIGGMPADEDAVPLHRFAAELLLQETGKLLFSGQTVATGASSQSILSEESVARLQSSFRLLDQLKLSASEQARRELLATVCHIREIALDRPIFSGVRARDLDIPITIDGDWQAQLLLAMEAFEPNQPFDSSVEQSFEQSEHLSPQQAEKAILFPDLLGKGQQWRKRSEILLDNDSPEAAEFLALTGIRHQREMGIPPGEDDLRLLKNIRASRLSISTFKPADVSASAGVNADSRKPAVKNADDFPVVRTVSFSQKPVLRTPDSFCMDVVRYRSNLRMPHQGVLQWRMNNELSDKTEIAGFDMFDGARTDQITVPFAVQTSRTAERQVLAPGITLLCGSNDVAVVGAAQPGSARLLWHRHVREEPLAGIVGVIPGPVGPDFVVWQSARRLHCSHPLTGRTLWSRDCLQSPGNSSSGSAHSLFGDENVIIVMGADEKSYRRYRTRDGLFLGDGSLQIGRGSTSASVGRKLIYSDANGRLRIFDGLTGEDPLSDAPPIELYSADIPIRVLNEGRIVTVTRQHEILVLDTFADREVFRTSVASQMNTRFVFGFVAFERDGRLYAGLNDEHAFGQQFRAAPVFGEPRTDFGRLFCLHPETGQQFWSTRTDPSVVLNIFGENCPLLITWTRMVSLEDQSRIRSSGSLRLRVQDTKTGEYLLDRNNLAFDLPVRGVYHQDEGTVQIFLHGSLITLTLDDRLNEIPSLTESHW